MAQIKQIGPSGQVSLGKEFAGKLVIVEQSEPGVWLIKTATAVPDAELRKQAKTEPETQPEAKSGTLVNLLADVDVKIPAEKTADESVREPATNPVNPARSSQAANGAGQAVVPTVKP
jgi:hypothetical protein